MAIEWQAIPRELAASQVYINGDFYSGDQAAISVWDHGLLYGDGIFEGLRSYGGRIFKLDAHLDRLYQSAQVIGLRIPGARNELRAAALETIRHNNLQDAHMRIIVTRGLGKLGVTVLDCQPNVLIMAYPKPPSDRKPVRCTISSVRRKSPLSVDARIKSLNYMDGVLAMVQASAGGYQVALLLDPNGHIAEAPGDNIFIVRGGELITPPTTACLAGITRATLLELCKRLGIPGREEILIPGDLYIADEAFLCSTGGEITPIGEVDGRHIGGGKMGAVTSRLAAEFDKIKGVEDAVDAYQG